MSKENINEIINRIEKLEKAVFGDGKKTKKMLSKTYAPDIDFSINERNFVKKYAVDKSGPKKFTLLLAYLVKGEIDKNFELSEIKNRWNKMSAKSMLGKFNMFYPNDAKTRGWIDSREYGKYNLTKEWKNVL
ncbi:MAG: hypothetical protein WCY34_06095 [Candidatus Omnitrophota bacterium]|jgi:hypothetical protein